MELKVLDCSLLYLALITTGKEASNCCGNSFQKYWTRTQRYLGNNCSYLSGSDLDVEVVPLVGDFEDLRPGKAVYSQAITVDEKPIGTHS